MDAAGEGTKFAQRHGASSGRFKLNVQVMQVEKQITTDLLPNAALTLSMFTATGGGGRREDVEEEVHSRCSCPPRTVTE